LGKFGGMRLAVERIRGTQMLKQLLTLTLVSLAVALPGCGPNGGTYCQSGPKYGTQCYSQMDLQPPGTPPVQPDDRSRR
jgi:hypothetical protein